MLIFTLRTGDRIVNVRIAAAMRHQHQTPGTRQRDAHQIEPLAIRKLVIRLRVCPARALQQRIQFRSLRIGNRRFTMRGHDAIKGDNLNRSNFPGRCQSI